MQCVSCRRKFPVSPVEMGRHAMRLLWKNDELTERVAKEYSPIDRRKTHAAQFGGCNFHPKNWEKHVAQPSQWPDEPLCLSPDEIITQFRNNRYTQAIAMVVSWGGMQRTAATIWTRDPARIEAVLRGCAKKIRASKSIKSAWSMLAGSAENQLGWSDVMASKTLHFLCRSIGFEQNPPVPIDGKIIVKKVWPDFWKHKGELSPDRWRQNGYPFDAYNRYMTAIQNWANQKQWTTTQVEATIFSKFSQK